MRNPHQSTGWVVNATDDKVRFVGTCFSFRSPRLLLTAAHCVHGLEWNAVSVTPAREQLQRGHQVVRIEVHPVADVAALWIEHGSDFDPFSGVSRNLDWGDEVAAFGYPEDTVRDRVLPTPRYFRGHVQRLFWHSSHLLYAYSAAELSFPAPGGLSGGPVASRTTPSNVAALVAENALATTYLQSRTDYSDATFIFSEKVHSTVEYALAVVLEGIEDWLNALPVDA